jgi:hypothetical protein
MPPKRSESRQKLANQEGKIELALQDVQQGRIKSLHAAAKLYDIPYTTLHTRSSGISSRVDTRWHSHKLTQYKEDSLAKWIISIDTRGAAPRPSTMRQIANILLAARGDTPPPTISKNWPSSFVKRRDELRSRYSRRYNYQRALNEKSKGYKRVLFNSATCD